MNSVLYYPHLYPTATWLRIGALCWDRVYSFTSVSAPSTPDNLAEVNEAMGNPWLGVNVADVATAPEIIQSFRSWLDEYYPTKGSKKYDLSLQNFAERAALFSLYKDKFPGGEFLKLLAIRNLVFDYSGGELFLEKMHDFSPSDVLAIPKDVALHYLSLCAGYISVKQRLDICADESLFVNTAVRLPEAARHDVGLTVLELFLPENVEAVPLKVLAEIRQELATHRLKFQNSVDQLVREFSSVTSEGQYGDFRRRVAEIAKERIESIARAYKRQKLVAITRAAAVSIAPPALVTTLQSILNLGLVNPIAIFSGVAFGVVSIALEFESARAERQASPWSYVLEVQHRTARGGYREV